jgi:hypothetical protein
MPQSKTQLDADLGSAWHVNSSKVTTDLGYITGSGSPVGVNTPDHIGQEYFDTVGLVWWVAIALTTADWQITALANSPSGTLGFYGTTPITQRTSAAEALVTTTPATSGGTFFGYQTAAQANALVTLVDEIRNTLVALGLFKGS